MNKYTELKKIIADDISNFPFLFAFSDKQFKEGMEKLGLKETDTKKLLRVGSGMFIRKTDKDLLMVMTDKHDKMRKEAMKDNMYLHQAFLYELGNHEYGYTYDEEPSIEAVGLTVKEVDENKRLTRIFVEARTEFLISCED